MNLNFCSQLRTRHTRQLLSQLQECSPEEEEPPEVESDAEIDGFLEEYWSDNDSDGCEVLEGADSSKETNDDTLEPPLKKA